MSDQTVEVARTHAATNYLNRVERNPSESMQLQLRRWLSSPSLRIDNDGLLIAYKGLTAAGLSPHAGVAYVNGVKIAGQIPNPIGATVLMPRDRVNPRSDGTCAFGLHAGTRDYADAHSTGMVVEVRIDPADVVSAPDGESFEEVRVCRYVVADSYVLDDRFPVFMIDDEPLPPEPDWDEPDYVDEDGYDDVPA